MRSIVSTPQVPVPKSPEVAKFDEVQTAVAAKLRLEGFRVRGRTFNRTTEDATIPQRHGEAL
jgi:hypothetical protein